MKKYLIALFWFSLTCAACYNTKKAERQINKALIKYPVIVAQIARTAFPCIVLKLDTIFKVVDTTIWIECPTVGIDTSIANIDSSHTLTGKSPILSKYTHNRIQNKVPIKISLRIPTITKTIEDSAQIELLTNYIDSQNLEIEKIKKQKADSEKQIAILEKKIITKNRIILILSLLIALPILAFLLKALYKLR